MVDKEANALSKPLAGYSDLRFAFVECCGSATDVLFADPSKACPSFDILI